MALFLGGLRGVPWGGTLGSHDYNPMDPFGNTV